MSLSFRNLKETEEEYRQLYKWLQQKSIYEWFEQRKLSLTETKKKYERKLKERKQKLLIIQWDNQDIGLVQIYPFEEDNTIYEFDLFIEKEHQSQGIGTQVVNTISKEIFKIENVETIILRPFKRNKKAIKCYEKCGYIKVEEYLGTNTLGDEEEIVLLAKQKDDNK